MLYSRDSKARCCGAPAWLPNRSPRRPRWYHASLVGREREQAILRDALGAALAGRGSLVLIGGEAGIGKTALAEALLAEAAARGALVLVGRCYDLSETPPYGPWRELFARAPRDDGLPALPAAVLPPEREGEALASQDAIVRRVVAYLAALAARRPLVLLLEDLHWADPASLDLLRVVARGLADAAAPPPRHLPRRRGRPRPPARRPAARSWCARPAPRGSTCARCDAAAIGALVAARYALARRRPRPAGRLPGRGAPRATRSSWASCCARSKARGCCAERAAGWALGDLAAGAGAAAAAAGHRGAAGAAGRRGPAAARGRGGHRPGGAARPLGGGGRGRGGRPARHGRAGDRGAAAGARRTAGVRFAHALIREALYEGVLAPRRRAWHRRAGEALLATPHPDPDAVAYHFRRAGDPRAVEWLVRAGRARASGAYAWLDGGGALRGGAGAAGGRRRAPARARLAPPRACAALRRFADTGRGRSRYAGARRRGWRARPATASWRRCARSAGRSRGHLRLASGRRAIAAGLAALLGGAARAAALPAERARRLGGAGVLGVARGARHLPAGASRTVALIAGRCARPGDGSPRAVRDAAWPGATALRGRRAASASAWLRGARASRGGAHAGVRGGAADCRAPGDHNLAGAACARCELLYVGAALPTPTTRRSARGWRPRGGGGRWRAGEAGRRAAPPCVGRARCCRWRGAGTRRAGLAGGRASAWTESAQRAGARGPLGALARPRATPALAWARCARSCRAGPATRAGRAVLPRRRWRCSASRRTWRSTRATCRLRARVAGGARPLAGLERRGALAGRGAARSGRATTARRATSRAARAHAEHGPGARQRAAPAARPPRRPPRCSANWTPTAGQHAEAAAHLDAALALAEACAAPYERALTLLALAELRAADGRRRRRERGAGRGPRHPRTARRPPRPRPRRRPRGHARAPSAPRRPTSTPPGCRRARWRCCGCSPPGGATARSPRALASARAPCSATSPTSTRKIGAHNRADATAYALAPPPRLTPGDARHITDPAIPCREYIPTRGYRQPSCDARRAVRRGSLCRASRGDRHHRQVGWRRRAARRRCGMSTQRRDRHGQGRRVRVQGPRRHHRGPDGHAQHHRRPARALEAASPRAARPPARSSRRGPASTSATPASGSRRWPATATSPTTTAPSASA